ncbi:MAG: hypothetical protein Q7T38_03285, partial [Gallionella sp.]|nr:hypothetical protein [Gallionella sp.]
MSTEQNKYWAYPVLPAVLGAIGMLASGGFNWQGAVAAVVVLTAGIAGSVLLGKQLAANTESVRKTAQDAAASVFEAQTTDYLRSLQR